MTRSLHADDAGLVRAPAAIVHDHLADVSRWSQWWPGVAVRPGPAADRWVLRWRDGVHRLDLWVVTHRWRPGRGFHLSVAGDLRGRAEFWLEPLDAATIVHHLLAADPTPRSARRRPATLVRTYRRVVRRGLWACKEVVEADVLGRLDHAGPPGPVR